MKTRSTGEKLYSRARSAGDCRLDELHALDANEFFDVYRTFRPAATREQFDRDWEEFQLAKAQRQKVTALQ